MTDQQQLIGPDATTESALWHARMVPVADRIHQDVAAGRWPAKDDVRRLQRYHGLYMVTSGGQPCPPEWWQATYFLTATR